MIPNELALPTTTLMLLLFAGCARVPVAPQPAASEPVSWTQVAAQEVPEAGERIAYGTGPQQFGELRLPAGAGPHPVAVILHGGCWRAEYDLAHIAPVSAALARSGIATWTLEYRRIGDAGGGWSGTFEDVARGTDHLRTVARQHPLDLKRVVLIGHSAGGHLALWLGARRNLPPDSPLYAPDPLPLRGVVSLAAITDLRRYAAGTGNCNAAVAELMGGLPQSVPDRYAQGSPVEMLPLGVPQRLVHGSLDPIVPLDQSERFAARATSLGDDARVILIDGAGHFDLIAPFAPAWPRIEEAVHGMMNRER